MRFAVIHFIEVVPQDRDLIHIAEKQDGTNSTYQKEGVRERVQVCIHSWMKRYRDGMNGKHRETVGRSVGGQNFLEYDCW